MFPELCFLPPLGGARGGTILMHWKTQSLSMLPPPPPGRGAGGGDYSVWVVTHTYLHTPKWFIMLNEGTSLLINLWVRQFTRVSLRGGIRANTWGRVDKVIRWGGNLPLTHRTRPLASPKSERSERVSLSLTRLKQCNSWPLPPEFSHVQRPCYIDKAILPYLPCSERLK